MYLKGSECSFQGCSLTCSDQAFLEAAVCYSKHSPSLIPGLFLRLFNMSDTCYECSLGSEDGKSHDALLQQLNICQELSFFYKQHNTNTEYVNGKGTTTLGRDLQ